jgi:hypothetical protein
MENQRFTDISNFQGATLTRTRSLLANTFAWMFAALLISAASSLLFAFVPELFQLMFTEENGVVKPSIFAYITMFAPLAFVLVMNFGFNRLSYAALIGIFLLYSAVTGISLSFIFIIYAASSIAKVFLSTAALFALMAVLGYTTKTDLTKMGSFLMMALFGVIIASLINYFTKSEGLDYILSFVCVIIFTGLTAYRVQEVKNMAAMDDGSVTFSKLSIMSALGLYLAFINLFLSLLRLFGRRD